MKYIPYLFLSLLLLFTSHAESGISNGVSGTANLIAYIHPPVTLTRDCEYYGNLHTVKYTYNPSDPFTLPAVGGATDKPHYSAFITVFNKNNRQISKGWFGQVVPDGGCIEDVPENMVHLAYQKEREEVESLIKERSVKTNQYQIENVKLVPVPFRVKIDPGVYTITNYSVSITTNLLVLTNYNFKITTNVLIFTNNVTLTNKLATNIIFTNKSTTITNTIKK